MHTILQVEQFVTEPEVTEPVHGRAETASQAA